MKRTARIVSAMSLLMVVVVAVGQTTQTKTTTRPGQRSAEEMLGQMLKPTAPEARPLRPAPDATQSVDQSESVAPNAPRRPLLREGSLVLDRVARLTRGEDGKRWELTFDADGR